MGEDQASKKSLLSALLFHWTHLFFTNHVNYNKEDLNLQQLKFPAELHGKTWSTQLASAWENARRKKLSRHWLLRALWETYKCQFGAIFLLLLAHRLSLMLSQPYLLTILIEKQQDFGDENRVYKCLFWSLVFFSVDVVTGILIDWVYFTRDMLRIQLRAGLNNVLLAKILKLTPSSRSGYSISDLNNILSVDAPQLSFILSITAYKTLGIFNAFGNFILLYFYIGPYLALSAYTVMGLAVWGCTVLLQYEGELHSQKSILRDKTMTILTHMLRGIKVIKLQAWEKCFAEKFKTSFAKEMNLLKKLFHLRLFLLPMTWSIIPAFTTLFLLFGHVMTSPYHIVPPKAMFAIMVLVTDLKNCLVEIPQLIQCLSTLRDLLFRIKSLLLLPERTSTEDSCDKMEMPGCTTHNKRSGNESQRSEENVSAISIKKGWFSWNKHASCEFSLRDISLKIPPGSLAVIVGPVGSGKTALLSALLGEMELTGGSMNINGSLAYLPQQSWILNDTVRNNILFGKKMNNKFYRSVIDACALNEDLNQLQYGEETMLHEQGVNLSGGQKQRIGLARAVYADTDIIIMDDPTSAVDVNVSRHILDNLIGNNSILQNKTRVLATHNLQLFLPHADVILSMDKGQLKLLKHYEKFWVKSVDSELTDKMSRHENNANLDQSALTLKESNETQEDIRPTKKQDTEEDQQVSAESDKTENHVTTSTFLSNILNYVQVMGICSFLLFVFLQVTPVLLIHWSHTIMTRWVETTNSIRNTHEELGRYTCPKPTVESIYNSAKCPMVAQFQENYRDEILTLNTNFFRSYIGLTVMSLILLITFYWHVAKSATNTTRRFTESMLWSVLQSPIQYIQKTPLGKLTCHFGDDVRELGFEVPTHLENVVLAATYTMTSLAVVLLTCPWVLVSYVPIIIWLAKTQNKLVTANKKVLKSINEAKALESSRSYEILEGAVVIRAFKQTSWFQKIYEKHVDATNQMQYAQNDVIKFLGGTITIAFNSILGMTALVFSFAVGNEVGVAQSGLMFSYVQQMFYNISFLMFRFNALASNIQAIHRIKECTDTPNEASWESPKKTVPIQWPKEGKVEFHNFHLAYDGSFILQNINFTALPGEKIGVVGRTGAGKTSLMLSLFRLVEATKGYICIDDVDISKLGLHELRSKLAVIPQDPVLFPGTLRFNLDPRGNKSESKIWSALKHAHMESTVRKLPHGLNTQCDENGSAYSQGHRQLLCLARALLMEAKVLVLDEATSSVDWTTDSQIQDTIHRECSGCTVFTIAHRLETISDYDKILVLDKGKVVAYDSPKSLKSNVNFIFAEMNKKSPEKS